MIHRRRAALVLVAALTVTSALSACQPNRFVSGWVPWWSGSDGRAAIENADSATLLTDVSLFWYGTHADGTVGEISNAAGLPTVVAALRAKGIPVVPTIADGTGKGTMSGILANATTRAQHVQHIVDLVMANGYDGIDIDYEVFAFSHPKSEWPAITVSWVNFVNELGAALHGRGKLLSVTVPPVYVSAGVTRGYTVYAQSQIAASVDRLRLMVYDWSVGSPGPIAPLWYVNAVIAYSTTQVPTAKLQLGVPTYGRHWATQKNPTEVCPDGALWRDSIEMTETGPLAFAHGLTPVRDSSGELTFTWTERVSGPKVKPVGPPGFVAPPTTVATVDGPTGGGLQPAYRLSPYAQVTCTVQHTVYAPDAVAVRARADAALAAHWSGIVLWAFGYETTDVYSQLGGISAQRPNGNPAGLLDPVGVVGTRATVTGFAVDPEFDLPVAVRLTVSHTGGSVVAVVTQLARTTRVGLSAGLGPFHGISAGFTLAAGNYTVCGNALDWGGATGASLGCQSFTITGAI